MRAISTDFSGAPRRSYEPRYNIGECLQLRRGRSFKVHERDHQESNRTCMFFRPDGGRDGTPTCPVPGSAPSIATIRKRIHEIPDRRRPAWPLLCGLGQIEAGKRFARNVAEGRNVNRTEHHRLGRNIQCSQYFLRQVEGHCALLRPKRRCHIIIGIHSNEVQLI